MIEVESAPEQKPPPKASTTGFVEVLPVDSAGLPTARPSELLEQVPGVQVQRLGTAGRFSTLSIRGASAGQVEIFLDGLPLFHPAEGVVNLEDLPLDAIDRVEVYRGTSPLAFGADAVGGVVNLVSRSSPEALRLRARLAVGTFGERRISAGLGGSQAGWQYQVLGGVQQSRGNYPYYSDNGTDYTADDDSVQTLTNNDSLRASALGRLERDLSPQLHLKVQGTLQQQSMGVLGLGQGVQTSAARYDAQQGSAFVDLTAAGLENRPLRLNLTLDGFWKNARLDDPLGEVSLVPVTTLNHLQSVGVTAHGTWVLARPAIPRAGVLESVLLTRIDQSILEPENTAYGRARVGLGLQYDQLVPFGSGPYLTLQPGLLLDMTQGYEQAVSTGALQTLASPRLGGHLSLSPLFHNGGHSGGYSGRYSGGYSGGHSGGERQLRLELRTNGGLFHRLPTFYELYGNQGSVIGNPFLRPEQGVNVDGGFELSLTRQGPTDSPPSEASMQDESPRLPHLSLEGVVFAQSTSDLILFVQNSQNTLKPQNIAAARTFGQELSASLTWHPQKLPLGARLRDPVLHLQLAYTHLEAVDQSGIPSQEGKQLPGRPEHALSLMTNVGLGAANGGAEGSEKGAERPVQLFYRLTGRSKTALEPSHTLMNPGRWLSDVGVSLRPAGLLSGFKLSVEVRNVTDTFYSAVDYVPTPQALVDVQAFPLPGRTMLVQLGWDGG